MMRIDRMGNVALAATLLALGACGGGDDGDDPSPSSNYSIGGTASGLSGSAVLQLNGANNLTVSAPGAFTFPARLAGGSAYAVTVLTQPAGQTCTVGGGTGSVASANVSSVALTCTNNTYTVGGAVSGLSGSVVLQLNGAGNLTVNASGPFTFGGSLASGAAYTVTVLTPPAGQSCAVNAGTGSIASANVSNVAIDCTGAGGNSFTVGGSVTGLSGEVVLRLNGANDLTVNAPGPFVFPTPLASGTAYTVSFAMHPATQVCGVSAGTGTLASADVTNVAVNCTGFTVGGSVAGLNAAGLLIQLNGGNDLAVASGSVSFTFPSTASLGGTVLYNLHIKEQPAGQTCTIVRAVGVVVPAAPSATTASVVCTSNTFDPLSGTYQLTAVDGAPATERGFITFYRDGTYIFAIHSDDSDCGVTNGNGIEYGVYRWNATTKAFAFVTSALDTNGDCGIADGNARLQGTLVRNANGTLDVDFLDNNGSGDHILATLTPVASASGSLVGSWGVNQFFTTFDANGRVFNADSRWPVQIAATAAGIEDGCYQLSGTTAAGSFTLDFSNTCALSATQVGIDTSGPASGLSAGGNQARAFSVSGDTLQFLSPAGVAVATLSRIVSD